MQNFFNDIELRYVLSKNSVNVEGVLFVKNILPETEGLSLSINNVIPYINGDEILFELLPKTTSINTVDIKVSLFFIYKIYLNEEKTTELNIADMSKVINFVIYNKVENIEILDEDNAFVTIVDVVPNNSVDLHAKIYPFFATQADLISFRITDSSAKYISILSSGNRATVTG